METYPVDIDAEQVVRWVKAEYDAAEPAFRITVRRSSEVQEIPVRRELHLGDVEREDLSEVETIATLEIAPLHASEGWLLSVVVEDEVGSRVFEGEMGAAGERQIDFGAFYNEFIRPGRGSANVIAEVENSAAAARLSDLVNAIEENRHSGDRGRSRR
jgi:hypothetical protein